MKKFILSLVIMSLGVVTLMWSLDWLLEARLVSQSVDISTFSLLMNLVLLLLGPAAIIYGAMTAFREAKK